MEYLVAGLRYTNASLHIREQVVLSDAELSHALQWFAAQPAVTECIILTTCNRTEVFLAGPSSSANQALVWQYFQEFKQFDAVAHAYAVFALHGRAVVEHAMRVAAGLDSLILGESQILGQVKDALRLAQAHQTNGFYLDRLFKTAIHAGKRVRTETGIAQRDDSVSKAAFELALSLVPELAQQPIAVIGGGKMAEIILQRCQILHRQEPQAPVAVTLVNRSEERLRQLTAQYGFQGAGWESMQAVLQQARVVFVATGAPHTLIWPETIAPATAHPRLILDISVPRNVDPAVGLLPGITLKNTDDLVGYHGYSHETEQRIRQLAGSLIEDTVEEFLHWQATLPAQRTMGRLRAKLESIRQEELAHLGPAYHQTLPLLDELSRHLLNKWLHEPTVRLRQEEAAVASQYGELLTSLFGLEEDRPAASSSPRLSTQETSYLPLTGSESFLAERLVDDDFSEEDVAQTDSASNTSQGVCPFSFR